MFFKKVDARPSLLTDFHSHILPLIDDGAVNVEEALEMTREFAMLGYKTLITTPHIKKNTFDNTPQKVQEASIAFQKAIEEIAVDMKILVAAEYYCDEGFLQYIKSDKLLHINRYVLFEFPLFAPPVNFEEVLFELKKRDYIPVLAHPERYVYYHNKPERYKELKNLGIYFQINLNSLVGYYSKPVKDIAYYLAHNGLVDFVGSDAHNVKHTALLHKVIKSKEYDMLIKNNTLLNDTFYEGVIL